MKHASLWCFVVTGLCAQSLPVVSMQTDPDRIAQSLRDKKPAMPTEDCAALDLWECHSDYPDRVSDLSLRWVQLDDDPELEAILIVEAKAESTYMAYVFDKQSTWRMVGSFSCERSCEPNSFVRVQKLTSDSPLLILVQRDLGGSAQFLMTASAYHLHGGRLSQALEVSTEEDVSLPPERITRRWVLASQDRLVIHTTRQTVPARIRNNCEVYRWSPVGSAFELAPADRAQYCDLKTGAPIPGKSSPTGLGAYP
ncbi:MAG: hypothetical protein LAP61_08600 [Acidobacteriia bacterium]|nr:hypothetical protein [Terriglobia bacterium]